MAFDIFVRQGAPFIDHLTDPAATFAAADANEFDDGIFNAYYMPAVRAWHNTTQSITTATYTTVSANSEDFDQAGNATDTMHDNSTNNHRLTCRYAGIYLVIGHGTFAANATGIRQARLRNQAASEIAPGNAAPGHASAVTTISVQTLVALAVSNWVEMQVYQNSGGSLDFTVTGLSMVRVG